MVDKWAQGGGVSQSWGLGWSWLLGGVGVWVWDDPGCWAGVEGSLSWGMGWSWLLGRGWVCVPVLGSGMLLAAGRVTPWRMRRAAVSCLPYSLHTAMLRSGVGVDDKVSSSA